VPRFARRTSGILTNFQTTNRSKRVKLAGASAEVYGEMPMAAARPKVSKTVTATLVVTACALALGGPAEASSAGRVTQYDTVEPRLVAQINQTRAARGLPRVRVTSRLVNAATRHANSMGAGGYFSHDLLTAGGFRPFATWIRSHWPGPGYRSWSAGENLFCATYAPSAREVVSAWMASTPHRANLLNRRWRNVGVAAVRIAAWPGAFQGCVGNVTLVAAEFGRRS
jgi:uncharacterized protein YkwD